MFKIETCLLLALSAWSLCEGSFFEGLLSRYVDDEPYPNQCKSVCLNALQPLLNESKSKLDKLEGQQVKMEERLIDQHQADQNEIEDQLQAVQRKVEEVQAQLERDLLAVKTTLQGQQEVLTKIETQLQAIIKNINANQAAIEDIPERVTYKVPKGFYRIGERYFRIVEDPQNWHSAAKKCREMGGYLAAFRDQKEFDAVRAKLSYIQTYWTGINDIDTNGHFVSVASKKKTKTLVYNGDGKNGCVYASDNFLQNWKCNEKHYFVCQSDNET